MFVSVRRACSDALLALASHDSPTLASVRTGDPAAARDFHETCGGRTLYKPVTTPFAEFKAMGADDLDRLDAADEVGGLGDRLQFGRCDADRDGCL